MSQDSLLTTKDVYSTFMKMMSDAETISWSRFNNFLVFNSVLIFTWVHLWNGSSRPAPILIALSVTGVLSGILWAGLGYRGRKFLDKYMNMAKAIELLKTSWVAEIDLEKFDYKPASVSLSERDSMSCPWAGSRGLLIGVPLYISLFHAFLLGYALGCIRG